MRLFIAINFTQKINDHLTNIIEELKKESKRGSFTRAQNLHLTLAFLGEIQAERVFDIIDIIRQSVACSDPFEISVGGLGKFITRGEFLYWCGLKKSEELCSLQQKLITHLMEHEFLVDCKAFQPHITLGRRCIMNRNFDESGFAKKIQYETMRVTSIDLMESEQKQGKLVYTKIEEVLLEDHN